MTEKSKIQITADQVDAYLKYAQPIEQENKQAASAQLDEFNAAFERVFEGGEDGN